MAEPDVAVKLAELDAKLKALEGSVPDKIELRVAESERGLRADGMKATVDVSHVKGQLAMLTAGGVLTFLLSAGGIGWLVTKTLDIQRELGNADTRVRQMVTQAQDEVQKVSGTALKSLREQQEQQRSQDAQIRKQEEDRLRKLFPASAASASAPGVAQRLECITKIAESETKTYPSAVAVLDAKEVQANYKVVSGGCSVPAASPDGVRHNIPIIRSSPDPAKNGWYCAAGDPPNIPVPGRVTAYAVACRLT